MSSIKLMVGMVVKKLPISGNPFLLRAYPQPVECSGVSGTPNFQSFDKAESNSKFCGKYIHNNIIGMWVSLICKLSGTPD
jgi:hypothetical protein